MIYREIALPEDLRSVALCAWLFMLEASDPPAVEHSIPPDGTTNFLLTRAPDNSLHPRLVGPSLLAGKSLVAQGFIHAGVRLRPEFSASAAGERPAVGSSEPLPLEGPLEGLWLDLAELIHGSTRWRRSLPALQRLRNNDPAVSRAVDLLIASGGTTPIAGLASQVGLSERQFRRHFQAATGISPKQYAAVQRVRRALILSLEEPSWAEIAQETGFADQPHLTRDIKERFGAAPGRVGGYIGRIRHEFVTPAIGRFVQDRRANAT